MPLPRIYICRRTSGKHAKMAIVNKRLSPRAPSARLTGDRRVHLSVAPLVVSSWLARCSLVAPFCLSVKTSAAAAQITANYLHAGAQSQMEVIAVVRRIVCADGTSGGLTRDVQGMALAVTCSNKCLFVRRRSYHVLAGEC